MSTAVLTTLEDRESGDSTAVLNAIHGSAKARVVFDATTNPPTIQKAFNVIGITDNGTGDFTINFENNINEAYAISGVVRPLVGSTLASITNKAGTTPSNASVDITTFTGAGTQQDYGYVSVMID